MVFFQKREFDPTLISTDTKGKFESRLSFIIKNTVLNMYKIKQQKIDLKTGKQMELRFLKNGKGITLKFRVG